MILAKLNKLRNEGHSGQIPKQQEILREITTGKFVYFEVGFNIGHSAYFVLENNPMIRVVSFSLPCEASERAYEILKQAYGNRLEVVWGDSRETLPTHSSMHADVAFIDGGHEYDIVRQDLHNTERHLKPDGIIMMDDVYCESAFCRGPTRAWKDLIEDGRVVETSQYPITNRRGFALGKFSF